MQHNIGIEVTGHPVLPLQNHRKSEYSPPTPRSRNARGHAPKWSTDSSTSEVATIQLEMRDLSRSTGDQKYEEASERVTSHIHSLPKPNGLVPIFINADTGKSKTFCSSLG